MITLTDIDDDLITYEPSKTKELAGSINMTCETDKMKELTGM